ncbi:MAG: PhzF family phenazine biosynthesis protein [Candidatus Egerieousia sp.]
MQKIRCYFVNAFSERADGGNPAAVCVLDKWLSDEKMLAIAQKNNLSETAFCVRESGCADINTICGRGDSRKKAAGGTAGDEESASQPFPLYHIRWFTPVCEVSLCGHATLATASILFKFFYPKAEKIIFDSQSGRLTITRRSNLYELDFPIYKPRTIYAAGKIIAAGNEEIELVRKTLEALQAGSGESILPIEIFRTCDVVAVFDNPEYIRRFRPCIGKIEELSNIHSLEPKGEKATDTYSSEHRLMHNGSAEIEGLIITAAGGAYEADSTDAKEQERQNRGKEKTEGCRYDFISRCFYPSEGIDEDPVTGSAHCTLAPYWHKALGKSNLYAYQASERGGEIFCKVKGDRIKIGGAAAIMHSAYITI